jgi:hypothetical protein
MTSLPFVMIEGVCACFSFTLRLAGGGSLGLHLDRSCDGNSALVVQSVAPGGAVEAWNKQCAGGPKDGKVVRPGDIIISVNGRRGDQGMLDECREKELLKLIVVRGNLEVLAAVTSSLHAANACGGGAPTYSGGKGNA